MVDQARMFLGRCFKCLAELSDIIHREIQLNLAILMTRRSKNQMPNMINPKFTLRSQNSYSCPSISKNLTNDFMGNCVHASNKKKLSWTYCLFSNHVSSYDVILFNMKDEISKIDKEIKSREYSLDILKQKTQLIAIVGFSLNSQFFCCFRWNEKCLEPWSCWTTVLESGIEKKEHKM